MRLTRRAVALATAAIALPALMAATGAAASASAAADPVQAVTAGTKVTAASPAAAALAAVRPAAGSGPAHPVTAYVAGVYSGTVTPINIATNTALTPVKVGGAGAVVAIAITPDGKTAYAVSNPGYSTVVPATVTRSVPL